MEELNLKNTYIIDGGLEFESAAKLDLTKIPSGILPKNSILNFENCNVEIHVYNDCLKIKSSAEPRIENK